MDTRTRHYHLPKTVAFSWFCRVLVWLSRSRDIFWQPFVIFFNIFYCENFKKMFLSLWDDKIYSVQTERVSKIRTSDYFLYFQNRIFILNKILFYKNKKLFWEKCSKVSRCHEISKKGAYFVHFFSKNCRVLVNDDRSSKSVAFSWFCRVLVSTTVLELNTDLI